MADESSTRRGKPTVSAFMGPSAAVLVGDFWLARTVSMVTTMEHRDRIIPLFAKTLSDLAEGEMLQLQKAGTADTTEEDYLRIVYCKTASLFEVTCSSAAITVDAEKAQTWIKNGGTTSSTFGTTQPSASPSAST